MLLLDLNKIVYYLEISNAFMNLVEFGPKLIFN